MIRFACALVALGALCGLDARAQDAAPRLYVGTQTLVGAPRVVGLGGAYSAVAEGASGFTSNLAALAQRAPGLERNWDLKLAFTWVDIPVADPTPRDLDNDGRRDQAQASTQFLTGLMLQYERFGVGTFLRGAYQTYCPSTAGCSAHEQLVVRVQHTALAGAMALGKEELIVGVGFYGADVAFEHRGREWLYSGNGFALDALYRPWGRPWRVGASVRPEVRGTLRPGDDAAASIGGRSVPTEVVTPASASVGFALRLGEGAEHFNRPSPAARRDLAERFPGEQLPPAPAAEAARAPWLLSTQLDLFAPVAGAAPLSAFTARGSAPAHGTAVAQVVPRLGVEHETLPGRLRLRGGTFLEPSPFAEVAPRAHLTGGAEVFLFRFVDAWAVSFSFDVAARYHYLSLTFGAWR